MSGNQNSGTWQPVGFRLAWTVCLLLIATVNTEAGPQRSIEEFYGEFVGHVSTAEYPGEENRDMSVSIRPSGNAGHFTIRWTTVVHKSDGRLKRKVYSIRFAPTRRPHIYSSAMKTNVFGGLEPLDPLQGDPFVWARIKGDTLTVHALMITDEGGYELQTYDRTLNEKGLWVDFSRRDRYDNIRQITTQLIRLAD